MLVSNQRPLPCEVCRAGPNAPRSIKTFSILTPISPSAWSMFSCRLLLFSIPVAAWLQHTVPFRVDDHGRVGHKRGAGSVVETPGRVDARHRRRGRPWASPVHHAREGYGRFYWVCSPEATTSRNLAARPGVAIVIFDSRVPVGRGRGVHLSASAGGLSDDDPDTGAAIFSRRSEAHGAGGWTPEDARPSARHRPYRAIASEQSVLGPARPAGVD